MSDAAPSPPPDDPLDDYVRINRANWNSRVPVHATGYDLDRFRTEPDYLSEVVRFDLPRSATSAGGVACTCSATSVRTRCRSPASART